MCARYPIREKCLSYALAQPDPVGVWGGTTGRERKVMRQAVA
jgi:WhiB family redox-sensing transcriptional regulator